MVGQQRGFWSTLFGGGPEREKFSLESLQHFHGVLLSNQTVTDSNRDTVVEVLRSIAELIIWGDQHDSAMVEYFLTENLLAHFNKILLQRSNRSGNVAIQMLQTLSILIQNVRNEQTVYYLFSNNHINEIVSMRFDFEDDEVLGYYVNLLKTISLKLNRATVEFFFQEVPGATPTFPLYTEAVKFINHRDGMVRAAVKTLTLNVFGIQLAAVQRFVATQPASAYFSQLAIYVAEQCCMLDRLLSSWDVASPQVPAKVESCLAEIEDLLSYCNDVLGLGEAPLSNLLLDCLWREVLGPVLFWPLVQEDVAAAHIASLAASVRPGAGEQAASPVYRGLVGPLASLYVFERLFHAITDPIFLSLIVVALLGGGACEDALPSELQSPGSGTSSQWQSPKALLSRLQYTPTVYRATVLGMLRGADVQLAAAGTRVLASLLRNGAVDEQLLELVGLLPRRRKKQRQLLAALTGDGGPSASPAAAAPAITVRLRPAADGSVRVEFVMPQGRGWQPPQAGGAPGPASRAAQQQKQQQQQQQGEESPGRDAAAREARQAPPAARAASSSPALLPLPSGSGAASAEASFQEIVEALLALLAVELLPPVSLGAVGWLLNQLLAVGTTGAQLHPAQHAAIETALQRRRSAVLAALQGPWCDALVPIASREWPRQLLAITRSGAGSVHVAVHTWMQAVLVQELHWQLGTAPQAVADANAAAGAKLAYLSTASLVGVAQVMQLLCRGEVAPAPPCPTVTEADVLASEIPSRAQVSLSQRLHCTVAFVRGEERAVVFGVEGVPGHIKADSQDLSRLKPAALHAVAACAPVAVVALPGAQPNLGLVLSTAPLLGTCPSQDEAQPRWLHIEVRPPLHTLLSLLQTSTAGDLMLKMGKQLASGHWVLSFPDADRAASAAHLAEEQAHKMRAVYCQLLAPLLQGTVGMAPEPLSGPSQEVRRPQKLVKRLSDPQLPG